jgi:uncharacterized coiled-coil protein SlyX
VSDIVERAAKWATVGDAEKLIAELLAKVNEQQARIAKLDPLLAEVKEWICAKCRYVYPGPPQRGLQCVICPRCNGSTGPRVLMELRAANERIAELEKQLAHARVWDREVK